MSRSVARQVNEDYSMEMDNNNESNYQKNLEKYKTGLNLKIKKRESHPRYYSTKNGKKNQQLDLIKNRLQVLSNYGWFNKFYKGQKKILENNPQSINRVLQELQARSQSYNNNLGNTGKEGKRKARKKFLEETIELLRQQQNQIPQPVQTAGSKKRRRRQKVKGKRVLKNGTLAGYVKQADGSWRWRFLPK